MAQLSCVQYKRHIPESGMPGSWIYCHENREMYFVVETGVPFPMSRVPQIVRGPQGEKGDKGEPLPGPQGTHGEKGDKGDTGERGAKGEPGDVTIVGDAELAAAVTALRAQIAKAKAALLTAMADSDSLRGGAAAHVKLALQRLQKESGL